MRKFRFYSILRKYERPYTVIRSGEGEYDDDGVWREAGPIRIDLRGHIQPISDQLKAAEGGNYEASDQMLFTKSDHAVGEVLVASGVKYIVQEPKEREYSDINQYVIRKVVANASL